jgi:hypothetical protein
MSQQALVSMMAGWNHDEGLIFSPTALPHNTAAQFASYLPLQFGNKTSEALSNLRWHPANTNAQANAQLSISRATWAFENPRGKRPLRS